VNGEFDVFCLKDVTFDDRRVHDVYQVELTVANHFDVNDERYKAYVCGEKSITIQLPAVSWGFRHVDSQHNETTREGKARIAARDKILSKSKFQFRYVRLIFPEKISNQYTRPNNRDGSDDTDYEVYACGCKHPDLAEHSWTEMRLAWRVHSVKATTPNPAVSTTSRIRKAFANLRK
jgi:hypothetical protein